MTGKLLGPLIIALALILSLSIEEAWAAGKPSDAYRAYLGRVYYAKSCKDVSDYFVEKMRKYLESLTGDEEAERLKRLKRTYVAKFTVEKEEIRGDIGYILAKGIAMDWGRRVNCTVRVEMLRETGGWKIFRHSWTAKMARPKADPLIIK